jgi:GNAT superfamily N-acetyltransferase
MSKPSRTSPEYYAKTGYTISTDPDWLDISQIYRYLSEESYWARGRSRELVERSIRHSLCFGVYTAGSGLPKQVGFGRVVSDFATFAYLADVFILPEYQGQGLGKWLVATMLSHPDLQAVGRWTLYTNDAHQLYRRFGFDTEQDPRRYMSYRPQYLKVDPHTD